MTVADADIGPRVAFALRQRWPVHTAKFAARATGASVNTVKGWLLGRRPAGDHLAKILGHLGPTGAALVLEPYAPWVNRWRMEAELADLRDKIDDVTKALDQCAAPSPES